MNELLKILECRRLQVLPEDFKPKISRQTIFEQLAILKRLKSGSENVSKQQENKTRLNSPTQETQLPSSSVAR